MKILCSSAPEPLESRIAPASATNINLADLDGSGGYEISSATLGGGLGQSVAILGDINNDTFDDYIVGAPGAGGTGAAYVIFGNSTGAIPSLDPASLDGFIGFKISGGATGDQFGFSVGDAGDVNKDGIPDIIVGAPGAKLVSTTVVNSGAAYVIYGSASRFAADVNVSTLNGTNGFKIFGGGNGDAFGTSVGGAGNVNGDSFDDVIIGAPGADANGADSGAAYVILGNTGTRPAVLSVNSLSLADGFRLSGVSAGDAAGTSVARAGDVNGDGRGDFIIGAPNADPFGGEPGGAAYVVFGRSVGGAPAFPANVDLSTLEGTIGFRIDTETPDVRFGAAVSAAGDFNGDGFDDLLVTVPAAARFGLDSGGAAVILGHSTPFPASIGDAEIFGDGAVVIFGESKGDAAGFSASGAGDLNGDGFADIVLGSPGGLAGAGKVHVVFGRADLPRNGVPLSNLTSEFGWQLNGEDLQGAAGFSVSIAGDVNKDGYADLLIGAPSSGESDNGAAYIVFGSPVVQMNPRTVTFMDADGDQVTIKLSKGKLGSGDIVLEQSGMGSVIKMIDLTGNDSADGGSLTIAVTPAALQAERGGIVGDGKTNIGIVKALGMNLKKLKVRGDVTQLVVGGGNPNKPGLTLFQAVSLGAAAASFPGVFPAVDVQNGVKTIKISENVNNVFFEIGNDPRGEGAAAERGEINGTLGDLKKMLVGGDVTGSTIRANQGIGKMQIKGMLKDTNTVVGGVVGAGLGKLLLLGVLDGSNFDVAGSIGSMKMTKDITDTTFRIGGGVNGIIISENITNSSVRANGKVNILGIGGDVTGSEISSPAGFGTVVVKGDFISSKLLAGYDRDGIAVNADAKIGKVTINKMFTASSIVAGALAGADGDFATSDDLLIGDGGDADVVSRIASVTIKGGIGGTPDVGDHFGFAAEQIGSVRIGSTKVELTTGAHNDDVLIDGTDDVSVREL